MKALEMMRGLSGSAAKLFLFIVAAYDGDSLFEVSMEELVSVTGMKEDTIRMARNELADRKLVAFSSSYGGRGFKTKYKLLLRTGGLLGKLLPQKGGSKGEGSSLFEGSSFKASKSKEKKKEDSNKNTEQKKSRGLDVPSLSPDEELFLYKEACQILEAPFYPNSRFAYLAKRSMRARIKEGFSKEDLISACRHAARQWENGNRWSGLKNLIYIWSRGFQPLLATKGEAGSPSRKAPVFRQGKELEQWKQQLRESLEGGSKEDP